MTNSQNSTASSNSTIRQNSNSTALANANRVSTAVDTAHRAPHVRARAALEAVPQ